MSYAIQNKNGDHLGFLLLAGEGKSGDCIFRSLPTKPELFSTKETELLYSYQEQGEFQWHTSSNGLEIKNPTTGSEAILNDSELEINGQTFNVIKISAS